MKNGKILYTKNYSLANASIYLFFSQITELCLDNCRSPNILGLTDEFVNLETLSLSNVGLTSLKGFPKLPNLKKVSVTKLSIEKTSSNLS